MKDKYTKLKALLLAGTIALSSSTLTGCSSDKSEENELIEESKVCFDVGRHIISEPIKEDVRFDNFQYDFHPGYEPIGISLSSYGSYFDTYDGGAIIYSNNEEVTCSSVSKDKNGEFQYLDFGTPLYSSKKVDDNLEDIKEFGVGEHIISVPIEEDNRYDNFQYDYHEGYEVVGVSSTSYGKYNGYYGGGVLLYKNITPVKCIRNDNGYTSFGIPIEKVKTKTLE